jgi:hypothetical protein
MVCPQSFGRAGSFVLRAFRRDGEPDHLVPQSPQAYRSGAPRRHKVHGIPVARDWDNLHVRTSAQPGRSPPRSCAERNRTMRAKLTTTQARQATGQRSTFWVLIVSLILAVIAGLILGLAFGWIPIPWSASA